MRHVMQGKLYALLSIFLLLAFIGCSHASSSEALNMMNQADDSFSHGHYAESEKLTLRGLEVENKTLGETPVEVGLLNLLSKVQAFEGKFPEAHESANKAISISLKLQGKNSPIYALSQYALGLVNARETHFAESEKAYQEALDIYPQNESDYSYMIQNHCLSLVAQNKPATACLKQLFEFKGIQDPSPSQMSLALNDLKSQIGDIYLDNKNIAMAETYYKPIVDDYETHKNDNPDNQYVGKVYHLPTPLQLSAMYHLADIYKESNRNDSGAKIRLNAQDYERKIKAMKDIGN